MKLKNIFISCASLLLFFSACEDLEQEVRTTLSSDQISISYDRTKTHLIGSYAALPGGFLSVDGAMLASVSDEAEHTDERSNVHKFNNGSWGPYDNPNGMWGSLYDGIYRTNNFLELAGNIDWGNYLLNPTPENQAIYAARLAESTRWNYEARFLRAYYYFELVKRYGGVPIITKPLPYDTDLSDVKRNTLNDCIQFIVSECDSCVAQLPKIYTAAEDLGRATSGAALALKSRTLLYAASELYNNTSWAGGYSNPELISLTGDRTSKWQAAADAAKAVIDLGNFSLGADYPALFKTFNNPEIIFIRRSGAGNSFEIANYPIGYDMGRSGTTPSQNLVDAYEMSNGKGITDSESGYNPQDPYKNRDPRLNMSIITNNSMFKGRPVECWAGGIDGEGVPLATRTGYYLKKYVDEGLNLLTNGTSVHSWHMFRLAEIYLNYAEALNEVTPGHADIKKYVDMVRQRTGVKMPALPGGLSQQEMRERIRNERRVELAFEDHRAWDVRRWMIAPDYLNVPLKGMNITRNEDGTFTYKVQDVENRVFQPKMYFYPIPQSELNIAKNWVQNPLW